MVQAAVEAGDQVQVAGAEVALNQPDRAHGPPPTGFGPVQPPAFPRLQWPRPPPESGATTWNVPSCAWTNPG